MPTPGLLLLCSLSPALLRQHWTAEAMDVKAPEAKGGMEVKGQTGPTAGSWESEY